GKAADVKRPGASPMKLPTIAPLSTVAAISPRLCFGAGCAAPTEGAAMIKLFYAVNTCSLASHIALEEAGAKYSTVRINFAADEQRGPNISPSTRRGGCRQWSPTKAF